MITVENVSKSFGKIDAVKSISFTVSEGEFVGLLGPNGAGKTTLIRMMIGLLDAATGFVAYDGSRITKDAIEIKKRIGVVSQHVNLDKEVTVEENMQFMGRLYHMPKNQIKDRTDELLGVFGLESARKRMCKTLSGGMKRKLMIARALIHDPLYLFLDEPTVGIDATYRKDIWSILKSEQQRGKTILLTSHYIEEVEHLSSRVLLIDEGKIFLDSTSRELIGNLGVIKVELFIGKDSKVSFHDTLEEAKAIVQQFDGRHHIVNTTLEDVFFQHTSKKVHEWK